MSGVRVLKLHDCIMSSDADDLDPDFGLMHFNIDAWNCTVSFEFPHPTTSYFAIHVWAPETGPTEDQRVAMRRLKAEYGRLWPRIAKAIVTLHRTLRTTAELTLEPVMHLGVQSWTVVA